MYIEIKNLHRDRPSEPYDFIVDRTTIWGNPFKMSKESDRDEVCDKYKYHFDSIKDRTQYRQELTKMVQAYQRYGRLRLFCWCVPKRCHAHTIAEYISLLMIPNVTAKHTEKN